MPHATLKNTAAIVVSFFPDSDFTDRIALICSQFCCVIIVDNTDCEVSDQDFHNDVIFLKNNNNLGIASALNLGAFKAREMGFDWVVTFDQDSSILPGFLDQLINIQSLLQNESVVIGSNFFDKSRGKTRFHCKSIPSRTWQGRTTVITSGMMLPTDLLSEIGGFREDYFIDAVDHEFCLRSRAAGYKVILACKPLMEHQIGHAFSPRLESVRNYVPYSHPPFRKYYMVRNTCQTIKIYWQTEPIWCLRRIAALSVKLVCIILEKDRKGQLIAFLAGLRDGILGKLGKRQAS